MNISCVWLCIPQPAVLWPIQGSIQGAQENDVWRAWYVPCTTRTALQRLPHLFLPTAPWLKYYHSVCSGKKQSKGCETQKLTSWVVPDSSSGYGWHLSFVTSNVGIRFQEENKRGWWLYQLKPHIWCIWGDWCHWKQQDKNITSEWYVFAYFLALLSTPHVNTKRKHRNNYFIKWHWAPVSSSEMTLTSSAHFHAS